MHLLISKIPRRKADARALAAYADAAGGSIEKGNAGTGSEKLRGVEMVSVVEVLSDRWAGLVGSWGLFILGQEGELKELKTV